MSFTYFKYIFLLTRRGLAEDKLFKPVDYGLRPLEANVYIFLLLSGRSYVNQVAREMGIARLEIYRVAREQVNRGIIEQLGYPLLYEAIHPDKMAADVEEIREGKILKIELARTMDTDRSMPSHQ